MEDDSMAMLSNLDLIRRVPLFSLLTGEQAQAVAEGVVKRRYRRGEVIVEQGTKSNALFILLTGRARVVTADSRGREVILAVLQPGDYLGEMSLIDNEPHSATVRAEVQCDALVLGRPEFTRCLPENSSLSTPSCAAWSRGCARPTVRSSRWRCSTSTAAWRAPCSTWPRRAPSSS
jgi:signal-transduction protein with cAMP-binding, CBS, and nucleotidyltransferase domain